ncbi:MAG: hypothetical protein ACI30B_03490 [Paludibacteraceae bacterium]
MNKELLIALMQKDLSELNVMLDGVAEWEHVPTAISRLALSKAENIVASLKELSSALSQQNRENEGKLSEDSLLIDRYSSSKQEDSTLEISVSDDEQSCEVAEEEYSVPENNEVVSEYDEEQEKNLVATVADMVDVQPSLNEIQQREVSVADSVMDKNKVTDLIQSISLGDRFRFQRELFSNNGEEMMQVFHDLNAMKSLDEAHTYLQKNFRWDKDNESVKDFYALLNRKF